MRKLTLAAIMVVSLEACNNPIIEVENQDPEETEETEDTKYNVNDWNDDEVIYGVNLEEE